MKLKISDLRRGMAFYELDHGVATAWVAMEDARQEKGIWRCLCKRAGSRVEIEFRAEYPNGHHPPTLSTQLTSKIKVVF